VRRYMRSLSVGRCLARPRNDLGEVDQREPGVESFSELVNLANEPIGVRAQWRYTAIDP